jgi:hypothetical protein
VFSFDDDYGFIFDKSWIGVLYLDKPTIPVTFDLKRKNTQ